MAALEKVGLAAADIGVKVKAMGLLQAYATRPGWEPEARRRTQEAAEKIQKSVRPQ